MSQKRFLAIAAVGILLAALLPYLIAARGNVEFQFGGFLINPIDGHSYLAKMQEGFRGEWKFTLPYTADPGQGAFLFLFYLALGHLARILHLPLLVVFHGARILGGALLILAVSQLTSAVFAREKDRKAAYLLILIGSGLGWAAILFGFFTSDYWVAEAYPFLALYTNPHFAVGLALMVFAILPAGKNDFFVKLILGFTIAVIQPFGVVIIGLVLLLEIIIWILTEKPDWDRILTFEKIKGLLGFGLGGGPFLIYQYWAILSDPVLAIWHAQNQTPTPGLADLFLSFSPSLIFALFGARKAWGSPSARRVVIWAGTSISLIFIPWGLQRRFLTGLFVPLAVLCIFGLNWLSERSPVQRRTWMALVFILSIPTNIIVIASGLKAAFQLDPQIYINKTEVAALTWIKENTKPNDLIVAEQDSGLLIPSETGRRVIYGHPFETAPAVQELDFIKEFFYQEHQPGYYREILNSRDANYVLVSDEVNGSLTTWLENNWVPVYKEGDRAIFGRQEQ